MSHIIATPTNHDCYAVTVDSHMTRLVADLESPSAIHTDALRIGRAGTRRPGDSQTMNVHLQLPRSSLFLSGARKKRRAGRLLYSPRHSGDSANHPADENGFFWQKNDVFFAQKHRFCTVLRAQPVAGSPLASAAQCTMTVRSVSSLPRQGHRHRNTSTRTRSGSSAFDSLTRFWGSC